MAHAGPSVSKNRVAGLALLGVAAVALVIGIVMALSGGSSNQAAGPSNHPAAPPPTEAAPPTASAPPSESASATPSPSTTPSSAETTTIVPPPVGSPEDGGGQSAGANSDVPVRVYNNSLVKGLAERAAADFRDAGYNVVEVANYPQGVISTTTIYYRPGTAEQATAQSLARQFGAQAQPRFPGIANASPGVIAIITKDFNG